ncbi:unnamed protein product [Ostreobium quekettii]|uniref:Uncharacterized protein n=1 Tax=Ostreobium quekettii TaxID=121088 RepID=A0A8S1JCZ5_9CHLO|nr:unnamed protein product [Ostreobium quekettii]
MPRTTTPPPVPHGSPASVDRCSTGWDGVLTRGWDLIRWVNASRRPKRQLWTADRRPGSQRWRLSPGLFDFRANAAIARWMVGEDCIERRGPGNPLEGAREAGAQGLESADAPYPGGVAGRFECSAARPVHCPRILCSVCAQRTAHSQVASRHGMKSR